MIKFGNFWPGIAKVGLTASNRGSIEHQPKGFSSETKLTLQLWAIQPIRNFAVAAVDIVIVIVIANNFVFVFIFTSMYHHSICWGRFHGWPVVWGLGTGWATRAHLSLSAYHLRMHIFFFFFFDNDFTRGTLLAEYGTRGSGGLASQILQLFSQRGCGQLHFNWSPWTFSSS